MFILYFISIKFFFWATFPSKYFIIYPVFFNGLFVSINFENVTKMVKKKKNTTGERLVVDAKNVGNVIQFNNSRASYNILLL